MSGHNPHGHLSQPNSSWNPLQIPSYIPRQPQLAHMSNERPLVRSPLTWHTPAPPTPPDAFYNYISASHKSQLELNPLLPSFVRGPSPFGSVDLTIQSARNSTTPSPRNLASPPPDFGAHIKQQIPRSLTPNNLNSLTAGPGVIQSTGSVRDKFQSSSNGNNGEIPTPGNIFIRDARQINEIAKMTARDAVEMTSATNEPVELVKESPYSIAKCHAVPTSPKRLSPTRPPSIPNSTPISPQSRSPLPLLPNTGSTTDIVNNHVSKSGNNLSLPQKPTTETIMSENSPLSLALPSPTNVTSNEDSVDSNASKNRRKRKPNKTTRVSNDSDESLNEKEKESVLPLKPPTSDSEQLQKDLIEDKNNTATELESKSSRDNTATIEMTNSTTTCQSKSEDKTKSPEAKEKQNIESPIKSTDALSHENHIENTTSGINVPETESQQQQQPTDEGHSVIVNNEINNENVSNSPAPAAVTDRSNTEKISPKNPNLEQIEQISDICTTTQSDLDSPRKRSKRKGDSDDIETIDKIAAMIASTNDETMAVEATLRNMEDDDDSPKAQSEKNETQNNNSKIHELTEILETPIISDPEEKEEAVLNKKENEMQKDESVKENCFEEVENKLEEMFAGIVDEEPPPVINPAPPAQSIDDPITSEVISELGLGIASPQKSKTPSVSAASTAGDEDDSIKNLNSTQKRPHSIKSDQTPPKKKRKIVKKSISNQKSGKSSKTSSSLSANSSKSTTKSNEKSALKEKIKEEPPVEYKAPFVQVKLDGTINVINAPIAEDIVEKQNKVKKSIHNHSNPDRKKIRGLHVSTLSIKYDADTTDATWMCVFCKRGPHKLGLGDLFGPYIIMTTCDEFAFSQKDPIDDEFISKRTKADMFQKQINSMPVVPSATTSLALAAAASVAGTTTGKKKRKLSDSPSSQQNPSSSNETIFDINEIFVGMTKVSDTSYEVWLHEDCAVWSSGVHIIGARIVGLEAAVWSSTRHKCSICSNNGAMICCLQRGCTEKAHIPCARTQNWTLDENEFKSLCGKHSFQVS